MIARCHAVLQIDDSRSYGLLLSLLFTLALLLTSVSASAEKLTAAQDPWPPYLGPDLEGQGLSMQIAREALRREGFELEVEFMPWSRALRLAKLGEIDLLVAAWWTKERTEYLQFSTPYAFNKLKFIKRKNYPFEFDGMDSLAGQRLGVVRGYGYGDALTQSAAVEITENRDLITNIRMIIADRLDLTLEDELVARHIIHQHAPQLLKQLAFADKAYSSKSLHVAAGLNHPNHQRTIAAFNRGLESMKKDGTLAEMISKQITID